MSPQQETRMANPSMAVVDSVAQAEGVSAVDLRKPLYESVDPQALDNFFRDGRHSARVTFDYHGYRVTVEGTGEVTLEK